MTIMINIKWKQFKIMQFISKSQNQSFMRTLLFGILEKLSKRKKYIRALLSSSIP